MNKEIAIPKEFVPFEKKLVEFKKDFENVVYDFTDPSQEAQAKKDKLAIGKVIASLDRAHKEAKAPLKKETDLLDSSRKSFKDGLLTLQDGIKSQIAENDRMIQEHAEKLQGMVEHIEGFGVFDSQLNPDSDRLADDIKQLTEIDVDDAYEHRKADATLGKIDALKRLDGLLVDRLKVEAEQAELAQLKKEKEEREQKDREDKIAADAASEEARKSQQAIDDAETAKQKVIDDAAQAKADQQQELKDAEKRHANEIKEAQEKADSEARQKIVKEQAAELATKKKEDAKKARASHRNKIHKAAKASFVDLGWDENTATLIVTQLKEGLISNASIDY